VSSALYIVASYVVAVLRPSFLVTSPSAAFTFRLSKFKPSTFDDEAAKHVYGYNDSARRKTLEIDKHSVLAIMASNTMNERRIEVGAWKTENLKNGKNEDIRWRQSHSPLPVANADLGLFSAVINHFWRLNTWRATAKAETSLAIWELTGADSPASLDTAHWRKDVKA
jgi:hypothetical protein